MLHSASCLESVLLVTLRWCVIPSALGNHHTNQTRRNDRHNRHRRGLPRQGHTPSRRSVRSQLGASGKPGWARHSGCQGESSTRRASTRTVQTEVTSPDPTEGCASSRTERRAVSGGVRRCCSEDPSARFAFGLRLLVDGIAAHSRRRPRSAGVDASRLRGDYGTTGVSCGSERRHQQRHAMTRCAR